MTLSPVVATAGSLPGREHHRLGRPSQDGHATLVRDGLAAAIVTDGCSSGPVSEVGARLFATILLGLVERHAPLLVDEASAASFAGAVTGDLVASLREALALLASACPSTSRETHVERFLLFGFLAAVVHEDVAVVFGVGDGVVVTPEGVTVLDPGPENAPPYPAYALLDMAAPSRVHVVARASDVPWLAIATDGLAELPAIALAELASDIRYAKNPSLLAKRLRVLGDARPFRDDATIAVLLRRPS